MTPIDPRDRAMAVVLLITVFCLGAWVGSYLDPVSRWHAVGLVLMAVAVLGLLWRLWLHAEDRP